METFAGLLVRTGFRFWQFQMRFQDQAFLSIKLDFTAHVMKIVVDCGRPWHFCMS